MKTKLDIKKLNDGLSAMIKECEKGITKALKDNQFYEAFEYQNAKEALVEVIIRIKGLVSEEQILRIIENLLKDYRRHIELNKKVKNTLYCAVCSDKIREIEDDVLNEIRMGTYDEA